MNERIKELYEHTIPPSLRGAYMEIHLEKFAELIWEEAYQEGFDEGYEQAILKERG